jgi:hypothetical protein
VNSFNKPPLLSVPVMKKKRGYGDGHIEIVIWLDNRIVHIASNFVGIGEKDTATR